MYSQQQSSYESQGYRHRSARRRSRSIRVVAIMASALTLGGVTVAASAHMFGGRHLGVVRLEMEDQNNTQTSDVQPSQSSLEPAAASDSPTTSPVAVPTQTATTTSATKAPVAMSVLSDGTMVGGWYAGASGLGVNNGQFAQWSGDQMTIASMWSDSDDENQRKVYAITTEYANWKGAVDIAVGGTVLDSGENYAAAARGAYDERWKETAATIADARKDAKGPTFLRPFHEMNAGWYAAWEVTSANSSQYKAAFARYATILKQGFASKGVPTPYIVFSPNYGDQTGLPIDMWYPGDDVVDVVGPDYYNDYQSSANASVAGWNSFAANKDNRGNPVGLEAWRQFALAHGKPMGLPEWGVKPSNQGGGDSAAFIKGVNAWSQANANKATWKLGDKIPAAAAGTLLYSCYFNVSHEGDNGFMIYGGSTNPNAAAAYRAATWGTARIG